jgi:hypothetical protein
VVRRILLAPLVLLAGCSSEATRFPPACLAGDEAVQAALAAPPEQVRVGGFRISTCVRRARNDGDLQNLGLQLTAVADRLAVQARDEDDPELARQLGFLAGAVRKGTGTDSGIAVELGRRVALTAEKLSRSRAEVRAALQRGLEAGGQAG